MQKDVGDMNERELLTELVQQGRRAERAGRIRSCVIAALLLIMLILALIYVPRILEPIRQLSESAERIEQSVNEAKEFLGGFDADAADKLKQTMESLNESSQQMRAFLDKLKDSGLDKLQSTIEGLNEALESILQFFRP